MAIVLDIIPAPNKTKILGSTPLEFNLSEIICLITLLAAKSIPAQGTIPSIDALTPFYNPLNPLSFVIFLKASTAPEQVPGIDTCILILTTSKGYTKSCDIAPAAPPAQNFSMIVGLPWSRANLVLNKSNAINLRLVSGAILKQLIPFPLKNDLIPPQLYIFLISPNKLKRLVELLV